MQQVTLCFTNLQRLLQFKEVIRLKTFELNPTELTLCCQCSTEEVRFALLDCKGAILLSEQEQTTSTCSPAEVEKNTGSPNKRV